MPLGKSKDALLPQHRLERCRHFGSGSASEIVQRLLVRGVQIRGRGQFTWDGVDNELPVGDVIPVGDIFTMSAGLYAALAVRF